MFTWICHFKTRKVTVVGEVSGKEGALADRDNLVLERSMEQQLAHSGVLPGFEPASALWTGQSPLYPSQQSALWAIRQLRTRLAQSGAIALHRGRTLIHREKLVELIEADAVEKACKRYGVTRGNN